MNITHLNKKNQLFTKFFPFFTDMIKSSWKDYVILLERLCNFAPRMRSTFFYTDRFHFKG